MLNFLSVKLLPCVGSEALTPEPSLGVGMARATVHMSPSGGGKRCHLRVLVQPALPLTDDKYVKKERKISP